jgi:CPA1 family monovalent cation:H+ antiporter
VDQFLHTETLIILLLLIASLVAIAVRRLRIPYTVALVIVGLLLTLRTPFKLNLTPEVILGLLVPPLVFEAAFRLKFSELNKCLPTILLFAVPGVIITTLVVGGILVLDTGISMPLAFLFGAFISATDPLAVTATFRKLGAPSRLTMLVEGESLLNDGTAIVMYNLMLAVILTGKFDLVSSLYDFIRVAAGGVVIGIVLGWLVSRVVAKVDDYLIEITLTTVLAYGSYLISDQLGFSGVLAVVAAGLINGNLGPRGMSPTTRIILSNFWEYVAFLVNSIVFLMIGVQIDLISLIAEWPHILWAIMAILVARIIVVYSHGWIANRMNQQIPMKWMHVLSWSGLRGAISLALALSLPVTLAANDRAELQAMTYGVVLFTLLVQSMTMRPLIRHLDIITRSEAQIEYETRHARLTALRNADRRIDRMHDDGLLSTTTWERLKTYLTQNAESLMVSVQGLLQSDPALEAEEMEKGWREMLRSQRSALLNLQQDNVITDEVYEKLTAEVDAQLIEGTPAITEDTYPHTQFLEVTLPEDTRWTGKFISELGLPHSAVLVSIRRNDTVLIPRGNTELRAGDVITTLCEHHSATNVKELLSMRDDSIEI